MGTWISNNIIYSSQHACIDSHGHITKFEAGSTGGHPYDFDEKCIKCGRIINTYSWNGKVFERQGQTG